MSPKRPLVAAVYVRLSVHRGEHDPSTSPERQREAAEAYCLAKGWKVAEVVEDLDVSGSAKGLRLERPGIQRLRSLFGDVDVIVFASLDRLARNVIDFRAFAEEAASHDVALVSVKESLDLTTPSGRFVATILAAFGEMEADTISERTKGGRSGAAQALRWGGGIAPYGYRSVPHTGGKGRGLVIEETEAAHVRRAAEIVLGGGSLYSALRSITEAGSTPRRAKAWSLSSLRVVLTNDATAGRLVHGGQVMRDANGLAVEVWEPVISYETVLSLRAALAPSRLSKPRTSHASRLLSGLLVCATCGGTLRLHARGKDGAKAYSCHGKTDGTGCDRSVSVAADEVERYVAKTFITDLGDEMERYEVRHETTSDLPAVEEALRAALAAVAEAATPDAVAILRTLQDRRAALLEAPVEATVEWHETGRTIGEAFAEDDVEDARRMLSACLADRIVVHPGTRGRRPTDYDLGERLAWDWRLSSLTPASAS
jgi:DNA invertase Pin-like site-specific DNA recombinase